MKNKLFLFIFAISNSLFVEFIFAQVPQYLSYQAIARNTSGAVLDSQNIALQLTIHDGTPTGVAAYQETHTTITNGFGLFTLLIGSGVPVSGVFANISWGSGPKYLQVELDVTGVGTNYTDMGTSQLMSVPYALYAQNTPSLSQASTNYYAATGVTYIYASDTIYKSIAGLNQSITVPAGVSTIFQSTGHVGGQNFGCWSRAVIALYVDGMYIDEAISNVDVVTDDNISSGGGNWHIIYPVSLTPGTHTIDLKVKGHLQNQCSCFIDDRGLGFSGHSIINVTFLKN